MLGIPTPQTLAAKALCAVAAASVLLLAGAYGGYRWELGSYESLKASYAQAEAKAQHVAVVKQATIATQNQTAGAADATAQQKIVIHTVTVTQEIPVYVHDQIVCPGPSVGLARVLYAAASGIDPSSVQLAAGQSDDACSDVTASEVAGWFTAYAGAARANSQQLNDLEDAVRKNDAIASAVSE